MQNSQANSNGRATQLEPLAGQDYAFGGQYGDPSALYQQDPMQVLGRRLWLIILAMVLVTGLAAGFSFAQTPTYVASTKILLEYEQASGQDGVTNSVITEVDGLWQLATTMTEVIGTRPVAESVVERLDSPVSPSVVQGSLVAEQLGETPIIEISYTDTSPERAQEIANTVGEVFSDEFSELSPTSDQNVAARVLEEAQLPGSPASPDLMRNIFLGLVAGLMLGVGLAFLLDYLDDGWRSREEAEHAAGVPVLGAIPVFRAGKKG